MADARARIWIRPKRVLAIIASVPTALCVLTAIACSGDISSLPDAKFPIPVVPGAALVDTNHAETGEDFMGQFRTVSWTLTSSKSLDEIVAFYKAQLPEAEEGQTDDGVMFLKSVPTTAKPKEKVMIFFYSNNRIFLEQDTLK